MVCKLLAAISVIILSQAAFAGPFWDQIIKNSGYKLKNHALCYTDSNGELQGDNAHKKSYLASTTKLVTTYVAVHKLGAAFKLTTKLYYNTETKELHIAGGKDPDYSKRKLFYLVNQLNNAGIYEIKKITFDGNFTAWSAAENRGMGHRAPHRRSHAAIARTLKAYLHTPEWNLNKKAYSVFIGDSSREWLDFLRMERNPENLDLTIGVVSYRERASFDISGEGIRSFNILSPKIEEYLKYTNIISHNYFADEFYRTIGKKDYQTTINDFVDQYFPNYEGTRVGFKKSEPSIKIYNGSGYPLENPRRDNYATCAVMVKFLEQLDRELEETQKEIQKIVAVTGVDAGTIKSRLRGPQFERKAVVKTGTTNPVSALMGMMNTKTGKHYFAIFNHRLAGISASPLRSLQNQVARKLMDDFGGGDAFEYSPKKMYPVRDLMIEK